MNLHERFNSLSAMDDDEYSVVTIGALQSDRELFLRWLRKDLDEYNGMLSNEALEFILHWMWE